MLPFRSGILRALIPFACVLIGVCETAAAQGSRSVEDRVARLERLMNSQTMAGLLQRVDQIHGELRELRGELELQAYEVGQLKERQRELYLDIDRRLRQLESGREAGPKPAQVVPSGPAAETALQPSPPIPQQPAAPPADPIQEQKDYQQAFHLLKEGRYEQAIVAFREFIASYPRGKYADNARYWLGETFYVTRRFEPAMKEFRVLAEEFPTSPKLTHALLKIGYIHDELGERDEAHRVLTDLATNHAGTTAARLAQERLQRMAGPRR